MFPLRGNRSAMASTTRILILVLQWRCLRPLCWFYNRPQRTEEMSERLLIRKNISENPMIREKIEKKMCRERLMGIKVQVRDFGLQRMRYKAGCMLGQGNSCPWPPFSHWHIHTYTHTHTHACTHTHTHTNKHTLTQTQYATCSSHGHNEYGDNINSNTPTFHPNQNLRTCISTML